MPAIQPPTPTPDEAPMTSTQPPTPEGNRQATNGSATYSRLTPPRQLPTLPGKVRPASLLMCCAYAAAQARRAAVEIAGPDAQTSARTGLRKYLFPVEALGRSWSCWRRGCVATPATGTTGRSSAVSD